MLYYTWSVDCTILTSLSSIASKHACVTEGTEKKVKQLLDYLASKPNARVYFHPSKMILDIYSDASYLSEPQAKSRIAGHFFLGNIPRDKKFIMTNWDIFNVCDILKFVTCSAKEAEIGALFIKAKVRKSSASLYKNLATHNHPRSSTVTTRQQRA